MEGRISLSVAALRLGLTYHQVREKLLRGELSGGRDEFGRFYVTDRATPLAVLAPTTTASSP